MALKLRDKETDLLVKLLFIVCCFMLNTVAKSETVYLASLEWPPYSGKQLPDHGASVAVAKQAFKAMGHELVVDFFPWSRAVKMAAFDKSKYVGYFPEYLHQSKVFIFSAPAGESPLGLIERIDQPIEFNQIEDLIPYKIGVVQDYINTDDLDALINQGKIKTEAVMTDEMNILKVAQKRIAAAVIDINVFEYLLTTEAKLSYVRNELQVNAKLLERKDLYIAFKDNDQGNKWLAIYNQGLNKIAVQKLINQYLPSHQKPAR